MERQNLELQNFLIANRDNSIEPIMYRVISEFKIEGKSHVILVKMVDKIPILGPNFYFL